MKMFVLRKKKQAGRALLSVACAAALLAFAPASAQAFELVIAGGAGNAGFSPEGELPHSIYPNVTLGASWDASSFLSARIIAEQDAIFGRKLAADFSYEAGFLTVTAGPVFGLLNGTDGGLPAGSLLQPGLRLGLSLFFLERILLEASSDFFFQIEQSAGAQFYPSQAKLAFGVAFPVILCSLEVNQKSAIVAGSGGYSQTRTDYGLYTRLFGKYSPFRLDVNFIYRTLDYESDASDSTTKSLVLGAGVEVRVKMVEIFLNGEGSIYTIESTGDNPFMFNAMAGVRIHSW